jgi:hypothetical protein
MQHFLRLNGYFVLQVLESESDLLGHFINRAGRCQLLSVERRLLLSSVSLELQLLLSSHVCLVLRPCAAAQLCSLFLQH